MDAPRDAAQAHAEAVKVETWRRKEGIKTSAELAFYFTTFEGAVGPILAGGQAELRTGSGGPGEGPVCC